MPCAPLTDLLLAANTARTHLRTRTPACTPGAHSRRTGRHCAQLAPPAPSCARRAPLHLRGNAAAAARRHAALPGRHHVHNPNTSSPM
eukprot:NODE_23042_length_683_cov_1.946043.p3 GENE.NODE_23042_length_683_cov_1.946043~~NODE_23042_length_683_cov_1.946043.p3  ORF type:complete len:88 (+),score=12.67 NODE_23042_length_683_cov_1.946043:67-330(+)